MSQRRLRAERETLVEQINQVNSALFYARSQLRRRRRQGIPISTELLERRQSELLARLDEVDSRIPEFA